MSEQLLCRTYSELFWRCWGGTEKLGHLTSVFFCALSSMVFPISLQALRTSESSQPLHPPAHHSNCRLPLGRHILHPKNPTPKQKPHALSVCMSPSTPPLYEEKEWEGKKNASWKQKLKCCRWSKKSKEKSAQTERQNKQLLKGFGSKWNCPLPPPRLEPGSACTGGGSQYQPHWDTGRHFCLTSCSDNPFS